MRSIIMYNKMTNTLNLEENIYIVTKNIKTVSLTVGN